LKKITQIEEMLNSFLAEKQAKYSNPDGEGKFRPSSFGSCFRAQLWKREGRKQDEIDLRSLRVFEAGHIFHEFIQTKIKGECEVTISDPAGDITGHADIVTDDCVLDIKTQHSKSFWYMEKKDCDIAKEKRANWLQVAWYAMTLGRAFVSLVFVSKDDLCIAQYMDSTEHWHDAVNEEVETLRELWEKDHNDPAIAAPRSFPKECEYCAFSLQCDKKVIAEKKVKTSKRDEINKDFDNVKDMKDLVNVVEKYKKP